MVREELAEEFRVLGVEGNCTDTRTWLKHIEDWLEAAGQVDIIHFNVGLHDIKRERGGNGCQVPIREYRANLRRIVERLQETGANLIWASITPVIYERHHQRKDFDRREEDVEDYNAVATEIMDEFGIRINDLHSALMSETIEDLIGEDGVHFATEGRELIADVIAAALRGHEAPLFAEYV
jgi:isoamyl acetate esterase